jgi:hypothetical protein
MGWEGLPAVVGRRQAIVFKVQFLEHRPTDGALEGINGRMERERTQRHATQRASAE